MEWEGGRVAIVPLCVMRKNHICPIKCVCMCVSFGALGLHECYSYMWWEFVFLFSIWIGGTRTGRRWVKMSRQSVSESKLLALVICYDVAQINGINPTLPATFISIGEYPFLWECSLVCLLSFYIYICCAISIWPIHHVINGMNMVWKWYRNGLYTHSIHTQSIYISHFSTRSFPHIQFNLVQAFYKIIAYKTAIHSFQNS